MKNVIEAHPRFIYTIGHSNLAVGSICDRLAGRGVTVVADVRRFPASRRNPQYGREALSSALRDAGIRYVWLGDDLGGFRPGGYEAYLTTDGFRRGISALETLARESTTAAMCAEADPRACHRLFIADDLARRGWRVIHILGNDASADHVLQEGLFP